MIFLRWRLADSYIQSSGSVHGEFMSRLRAILLTPSTEADLQSDRNNFWSSSDGSEHLKHSPAGDNVIYH